MPIEEDESHFCIDQRDLKLSSIFNNPGLKMTNLKMSDCNTNGNGGFFHQHHHQQHFSSDSTSLLLSQPGNFLNQPHQTMGMSLVEQDMCLDEYQYQDSYINQNIHNSKLLPYLRRANSVCGNVTNTTHSHNGGGNNDFNTNVMSTNTTTTQNTAIYDSIVMEESRIKDLCAQEAQKLGFIVGDELELVKSKSHRSVIQNTPDRIISCFKDRYGQVSDSNTKKAYLQLGVRVPSKEHVSEIVGKQGSKIKQIREKTGALITTPGEQEDHVFIIEAPPRTAIHVAQILRTRAEDITLSRSVQQEARRRSSCPNNSTNNNNSCSSQNGNGNSTNSCQLTGARHHSLTGTNVSATSTTCSNNTNNSNSSSRHSPTNIMSCVNNSNSHHHKSNLNNSSNNQSGSGTQSSKVILASGRIQVPKIIVGRIIGTQGSIITTIQRDTGTEIRSPPKEVGKPKNSLADFEIIVYKTANLNDIEEAAQRVSNAKQLIAHVAMHQLEKVRAEEAPYSNYQVQSNSHFLSPSNTTTLESLLSNTSISDNNNTCTNPKEKLLNEQMRPYDWIWPDVAKLEDGLAQEVVDRILEESKKKTKTKSETSIYDKDLNLFDNFCLPGSVTPTTTVGRLLTPGDNCLATTSSLVTNDNALNNGSNSIGSLRPRYSLPEGRVTNSGNGICSGLGTQHSLVGYPSSSFEHQSSSTNSCRFIHDMMMNGSNCLEQHNSAAIHNHRQMHAYQDYIQQKRCIDMLNNHNSGDTSTDIIHEFVGSPNLKNPYSKPIYNEFMSINTGGSSSLMPDSSSNYYQQPSSSSSSNYFLNNDFYSTFESPWSPNATNQTTSNNICSNTTIKSYADSVKPHLTNTTTTTSPTTSSTTATCHGTIGDHLKKTHN